MRFPSLILAAIVTAPLINDRGEPGERRQVVQMQ
jgi:hypothetical protein